MTTTESHPYALPESDDVICKTRPMDASRLVALVSAASALVWSGLLILSLSSGPSVGSIGTLSVLSLMLIVNVLHLVGQAIASALSISLGARFGALAVIVQIVMAMAMLLVSVDTPVSVLKNSALLVPSLTVSACAWVINRRHSAPLQLSNGG